jgi:DNA-binding LytR/AlgR family response regulator
MSLRVLVCDDEPIAVAKISSLLGRIGGVELVGTAPDGREALEAVDRTRPDLVLLDIEMPGPDGFDIARVMEARDHPPLVAFVTAYRRLALEAFDSGAVDFLSKPVRLERLEQSVERARRVVAGRTAEQRLAVLEQRVEMLQSERRGGDARHVWVQRRGEVLRVDLCHVDRVSADGPYVRLHVGCATYLHRETIGSMEARLGRTVHTRTHRSHIVRNGYVARIRRTVHGGTELVMRDGCVVPVGRSFAKDVRRRILHLEEEA